MPESASDRLGLVAPSATDLVNQGDDIIRALVAQLEAVGAAFQQGTSRPAAASDLEGYFYVHTTTGIVSYCTGGAWVDMAPMSSLPWMIDINPFSLPATETGFSSLVADNAALMGGYRRGTGQNAEIGWDVVLGAGTWTIALVAFTDTDAGIFTASLDGVTVGTTDFYGPATVKNSQGQISGISVTAPGKKRLLLKMATKHASSTNYHAFLQALRLIRTA